MHCALTSIKLYEKVCVPDANRTVEIQLADLSDEK